MAVYIPWHMLPTAVGVLVGHITSIIENSYPDCHFLLLGDFNHTPLEPDLLKYKQQVKCSTREGKTPDLCSSTFSDAYHAVSRTPLGSSDHSMIYLIRSSFLPTDA